MEFPQKMQHRLPMWRRVFAMWAHSKKRISAGLRLSGAGGLSFLCPCLFGGSALAEFESPKSEYFTGFEASDNYASGYVGAGYALGKAGLYEPGFRLRAVGGVWALPLRRRAAD